MGRGATHYSGTTPHIAKVALLRPCSNGLVNRDARARHSFTDPPTTLSENSEMERIGP